MQEGETYSPTNFWSYVPRTPSGEMSTPFAMDKQVRYFHSLTDRSTLYDAFLELNVSTTLKYFFDLDTSDDDFIESLDKFIKKYPKITTLDRINNARINHSMTSATLASAVRYAHEDVNSLEVLKQTKYLMVNEEKNAKVAKLNSLLMQLGRLARMVETLHLEGLFCEMFKEELDIYGLRDKAIDSVVSRPDETRRETLERYRQHMLKFNKILFLRSESVAILEHITCWMNNLKTITLSSDFPMSEMDELTDLLDLTDKYQKPNTKTPLERLLSFSFGEIWAIRVKVIKMREVFEMDQKILYREFEEKRYELQRHMEHLKSLRLTFGDQYLLLSDRLKLLVIFKQKQLECEFQINLLIEDLRFGNQRLEMDRKEMSGGVITQVLFKEQKGVIVNDHTRGIAYIPGLRHPSLALLPPRYPRRHRSSNPQRVRIPHPATLGTVQRCNCRLCSVFPSATYAQLQALNSNPPMPVPVATPIYYPNYNFRSHHGGFSFSPPPPYSLGSFSGNGSQGSFGSNFSVDNDDAATTSTLNNENVDDEWAEQESMNAVMHDML